MLIVSSGVYLFNSVQVVPKALLQRELRFKLLVSIEALRSLFQIIATLLFAWLRFRYWSLVIGYVLACFITSALTFYWSPHEFATPRISQLSRELNFSFHALVSKVAWYVYDHADFGVAGRVLGEVPLGNYTVAWTISSAPIEKITNMITGVTPAYFSAVQGKKPELRRYLLRLTELLSFATIPASIGLALSADCLVSVLLGPKWYGVIVPLRLLGLFVAARSVTTILPNLLTAIGDARFVMWATIGSAILLPIAFLIGSRWGITGIAAAWIFASPVIMAPMCYRVFKKTEMDVREYISAIFPAVNSSLIMSVVVVFIRFVIRRESHSFTELCIIVLSGMLSYAGALFVFYRRRVGQLIRTTWSMLKREQPNDSLPIESSGIDDSSESK